MAVKVFCIGRERVLMDRATPWKKEKSAAVDFVMALIGGFCLVFTVINEWNLYYNAYGRELRQPSGMLEDGTLNQLPGIQELQNQYLFWNSGWAVVLRLFLLFAGLALCAIGLIRLVHLCQRKRWIAYTIISVIGVLVVGFGLFAEIYMLEHPAGLVFADPQVDGELLYSIDLHYDEHRDWASPQGTVLRLFYWILAAFTTAAGTIGAARSRYRNAKETRIAPSVKRQEMLQDAMREDQKKK